MSAFALAAAAVHAPMALAQAESDGLFHDGRWAAQLELSEAGYQRANVVLADYGGTWQDTTPSLHARNKACAGKKFAITVQRSRAAELEFMVWGSSVSPACPPPGLAEAAGRQDA